MGDHENSTDSGFSRPSLAWDLREPRVWQRLPPNANFMSHSQHSGHSADKVNARKCGGTEYEYSLLFISYFNANLLLGLYFAQN